MRAGGPVLLGAFALVACSGESSEAASADASASTGEARPDRVACARSDEKLEPVCTREIASGPDGPVWVIRHPDGSFRRFVIIEGGQRIATADGAEEVRARRGEGHLDVFVSGEQYRFEDSDAASR